MTTEQLETKQWKTIFAHFSRCDSATLGHQCKRAIQDWNASQDELDKKSGREFVLWLARKGEHRLLKWCTSRCGKLPDIVLDHAMFSRNEMLLSWLVSCGHGWSGASFKKAMDLRDKPMMMFVRDNGFYMDERAVYEAVNRRDMDALDIILDGNIELDEDIIPNSVTSGKLEDLFTAMTLVSFIAQKKTGGSKSESTSSELMDDLALSVNSMSIETPSTVIKTQLTNDMQKSLHRIRDLSQELKDRTLNSAASRGHLAICRTLLECGAIASCLTLHSAIHSSQLEAIEFVESLGIEPDVTSLHTAITTGFLDIIEHFIRFAMEGDMIAMMAAVRTGNTCVMDRIYETFNSRLPSELFLCEPITETSEWSKWLHDHGCELIHAE